MESPKLKRIPKPSFSFNRKTSSDLLGIVDHFNGIIVDPGALPSDPVEFECKLEVSLQQWQQEERKGLWLEIPIAKSEFIPIAVKFGFEFHHSKPNYLMLTKWLRDTPSTLPEYTSHYLGVGGFVVRMPDGKEIQEPHVLVVMEKNGPVQSIWKVPGGMSSPGEDVLEVAVREVFEETGVRCRPHSVLGFRQHHNSRFGQSDMYFICRLEPETVEIIPCPTEIQAAKWMPMNEFLELPYYKGVYKALLELGRESVEGRYLGLVAESLPIGFRDGNNTVYHACSTLNPARL